jgi:hypothetical protein
MATRSTIKPRALKAGRSAEYLGISRRYLHDLSKQGRIPYSKISARTLVYDIADLDTFLEGCKIGEAG